MRIQIWEIAEPTHCTELTWSIFMWMQYAGLNKGEMDSRDTSTMEELEDMKGFAHIMNLLFSFVQPMVLKCMVQLGLPDIINNHGRALTLTQLSRALPFESVDTDRLHRILHHSVRMGLFTVDVTSGEPSYGLAPACKFLLRDAATSVSPTVLSVTEETVLSSYHCLSAWLDGKVRVTPWELKHGRAPWEMLAGEPELNRTFREGMAALTRAEFSAMVRDGKGAFEGVGSLVDVGGGTGMAARSIVKAFPHIECIVLDLPEFVAQATESPGVTFIAGDMFAFIPPTHTVFLKNVLHDWSDTDCVKILKQCKEAIAKKGGKIIIVDMVLEDGAEDMFDNLRLAMDLHMAVITGGRERTKGEWETLLQTAGLDISKMTHTSSSQSIIEAYPN